MSGLKVFIKPAPTSTEPGNVHCIGYPTFDVTGIESNPVDVSGLPDEVQHILVLYVSMMALLYRAINYSLPNDISIPVAPELPSLSSVGQSIPDVTFPENIVLPEPPSDISFVDTDKPTYSAPTAISLPTLDLSGVAIDIPPTAPSEPSFSYVDSTASSVSSVTVAALGTAPIFTQPLISPDWTTIDTTDFTTNDDIEKGLARVQRVQAEIQKYSQDIQNNLHKFNEGVASYQADLQKKIQDAQIASQKAITDAQLATDVSKQNKLQTLSASVQQYASQLQLYSNKIQSYQVSVNISITQRQHLLQEWQTKTANELNRFSAELQGSIASFNSNVQLWKVVVDRALSKYEGEGNVYQAKATSIVNEYQARVNKVAQELIEGVQKYTLDLQNVSQENQSLLNNYQISVGLYNSQFSVYSGDFAAKMNKVNTEYNWIVNQFKLLKQEYEQSFIPFKVQQEEKQ